jgi:hypothetical protein
MKIENKINNIVDVFSKRNINDVGLFTGETGIILAALYHAKYSSNNIQNHTGLELLNKLFNKIESNANVVWTFCSGIAGIGWLVEFASKYKFIESNTNYILGELDKHLAKAFVYLLSIKYWDFLHGAIGIGFYYLKRFEESDFSKNNIDLILDFLEENAIIEIDNKKKWINLLHLEPKRVGINISLSHGISSIIVFFLKIYQINIEQKRVEKLIVSAINYLLSQEIDKSQYGSFFPTFSIETEKYLHKSRLAWCYGDLGIATTLYQAGMLLQRNDWIYKSLEILIYAAEKRRDLEQNMVVDAGLCHGTAGIGHIFYRMWWNTKMPEFKHAADYWFKQTLMMAKFEDGLAGYKVWHGDKYGGWINDYGLLEGIAGIGLALMTYYYELEPTWDECLLLS